MVEPVYFEMIDPTTPAERRKVLEDALLTYSEQDTLAMVRLAEFFAEAIACLRTNPQDAPTPSGPEDRT